MRSEPGPASRCCRGRPIGRPPPVAALLLLSLSVGCGETLVDHREAAGVKRIGPGGGQVELLLKGRADGGDWRAKLAIPAGALDAEHTFFLSAMSEVSGSPAAVDIAPGGMQFVTPATVAFTYPPQQQGGSERFKVMTRVEGTWRPLPDSSSDLFTSTVRGPTPHLSVFGVFYSGEVCNNGLDDDQDGRIDCLDPACSNDPTCSAPCGAVCALGSACCPYTRACYSSSCVNCCPVPYFPGSADGGIRRDAGLGPVCGAAVCAASQGCCPYTGACFAASCLDCCVPTPGRPSAVDGGNRCGADQTLCTIGQRCCGQTGLCYDPTCPACCG